MNKAYQFYMVECQIFIVVETSILRNIVCWKLESRRIERVVHLRRT